MGGLLLDNRAWLQVRDRLSATDFFRRDHQLIYTAIGALIGAGHPCDFITLSGHFRSEAALEDVGGLGYLASMCNDVPSMANVGAYAEIVRERALYRDLIAAASRIGDMGFSPEGRSPPEVLAAAADLLRKLADRSAPTGDDTVSMFEAVQSAYVQIDAAAEARAAGRDIGITTGLPGLDKAIGAIMPGDLVSVAARTSVGKSALLNKIAIHAAQRGARGLIITLEETAESIAMRGIAAEARVNIGRMRFGRESSALLAGKVESTGLPILPIWINTRTDRIGDIEALATLYREKHGISWVVVDHVGLVKATAKERRHEQVGEVTRTLKQLAQRTGMSIIMAIQMNREATKEEGDLQHLAESDSIGRDSNIVIILSRKGDPQPNMPTEITIRVAKSRYGMIGYLPQTFLFFGAEMRFEEAAPERPEWN